MSSIRHSEPKPAPMFSPSPPHSPARSNPFANAYRQVGIETAVVDASPHRLVAMLFDTCLDALSRALGAMRSGRIEDKCSAITHATRIVDEGLRAALDLKEGGALAADLDQLYGYVTMRLTLANLRNDQAAIEECQRLISPLRDAWREIAPQVSTAAR
jgi:flagellar protein FliS